MNLNFDNAFLRELPGDPIEGPDVRQVVGAAWSSVEPEPVASPKLLAHSKEMARRLGFTTEQVMSNDFALVFGGNALIPGMRPYASNYGGHQFGNWARQLGDGRAISLGEVINAQGERWELQLKGAGPTPYSRRGDGRAVLRSSVREFVCSEAMHHLGVPTTRALSLVVTGEDVVRDMFYDGNARPEPGAIVCRASRSFIRFGTFELPASRGDTALVKKLADFCIRRDFPHLEGEGDALYARWFAEICERTALMIAHWMRVGFVHGVMNTDNMSVLGETIDYGPYGWVDNFDLDWTPNTTDAQNRRYRFGQQPAVAQWNLQALASALVSLFSNHDPLHEGLERYLKTYRAAHRDNVSRKLGLGDQKDDDQKLMASLEGLLQSAEVDMTIFFRTLSRFEGDATNFGLFEPAFYDEEKAAASAPAFIEWLSEYARRLKDDPLDSNARRLLMDAANPLYVPRNYLAQQAIDRAEKGDPQGVAELLDVLRDPYNEQSGRDSYASRRPDWARHKPGCSMLSCSS